MKKMENLKDVIQRTKDWTKEKKYKHVPYFGYFGAYYDRLDKNTGDDADGFCEFLITEEVVKNNPYSIHLWLCGVEIGEVMPDQIILKEGPNTFGLKPTFRHLIHLGLKKWGKLESDSLSPQELQLFKELKDSEDFEVWVNPSLREDSYKGETYFEPSEEGELAFRVTPVKPVSYYGCPRQKMAT